MISLVRLENFQSLADVSLPLGKLTVITGPSNSGKSALVRAIRHALTNPRGSGVVRVGTKEARVGIGTDRGGFTWTKPLKGGASFRVPGAVHTVTGTGADSLPADARAMLDIDPEIQVSDQFDGPFLLTRTAAQAAALLGSLSRADRILRAVGYANAQERAAAGKAKTLTELAAGAAERLASFDWYAPVVAQVDALAPEVDELYQLHQRAASARMRLDNANYTAVHARALRDRVAAARTFQGSVHAANQAVIDVADKYGRAEPVRAVLRRTYQAATAAASSVNEATTHHQAAVARLAALIEQLPGSACPTCGQPITQDAAHHIVGVHS